MKAAEYVHIFQFLWKSLGMLFCCENLSISNGIDVSRATNDEETEESDTKKKVV